MGHFDRLKKYNGKDREEKKDKKETKKETRTAAELEEERRRKEEEEKEEEELEKECEKWCSIVCKILIVVPILVTYVLMPLRELVLRPDMAIDMPNLSGVRAVVTGGCSGLGLHTALAMARSGASVVLGCRSEGSSAAAVALETLKKASKAKAQPAVWSLEMDSLESVRLFAERYVESIGTLHILVNNAGTTEACSLTRDGFESAFQVNYLSHFLLTNILLPVLRASSPSRIIHIACQEGYLRPARGWSHRFPEGILQGWLGSPVPIQETIRVGSLRVAFNASRVGASHELEASLDSEVASRDPVEWSVERCRPAEAYSNAKLAVLAFSKELEFQLRNSRSDGVTSHAINPNAMLTDFKPPATSERSSLSYFPPVWIAGKVFGFVGDWLRKMTMRSVEHGAKGVLHVASLKALERHGGGLFDDTETSFTKCGRAPAFCGRVPDAWLPPVILDERATGQLWKLSSDLVHLPNCDGDTCDAV
ncbi:unnamed protein product [Durusdinium trenchii]|uniref:WW domain-containing oxidoreductase n=3 Tax=Durusdinium trenchii TaxID=1381693 RepID=A0ABP0JEZ3_9DINO